MHGVFLWYDFGGYNVKGKMVNCFVMASNLWNDQSAL